MECLFPVYLFVATQCDVPALLNCILCVQQQMEFKPVPLKAGEDEDYMLALKQEIRGRMKGLPFNIKPCSGKSGGLCSRRLNHSNTMRRGFH